MNKQYDNTNKGGIWPNKKKETERHPDFRGEINVEGVEYWVSAWKRKEGDNPKGPSLRFAIQRKGEGQGSGGGEQRQQQAQQQQAQQQPPTSNFDDFDDDIPF